MRATIVSCLHLTSISPEIQVRKEAFDSQDLISANRGKSGIQPQVWQNPSLNASRGSGVWFRSLRGRPLDLHWLRINQAMRLILKSVSKTHSKRRHGTFSQICVGCCNFPMTSTRIVSDLSLILMQRGLAKIKNSWHLGGQGMPSNNCGVIGLFRPSANVPSR